MLTEVVTTGRTVDEAIENALLELKTEKENVTIEVLENPKKGFMGFIGQKDAKVLVRIFGAKPMAPKKSEPSIIKQNEKQKEVSSIDTANAEKKIKEFLVSMFKKMDIPASIEIKSEGNLIKANIVGDDMGIVIGRRGETLDAVEHITQLFVNKEFEEYYRVRVDTEDYRRKREEALTNLAHGLAKKVLKTRKEVALEPMKSYERRIIHTALQDYNKIVTHSVGEEPNRRLVVGYRYGKNKED